MGIRPENIRTAGGKTPGTVRIVENLGPARVLLVDWAGHDIHIVTDKREIHLPDDIVHPLPDPNHVLVWPGDETPTERG